MRPRARKVQKLVLTLSLTQKPKNAMRPYEVRLQKGPHVWGLKNCEGVNIIFSWYKLIILSQIYQQPLLPPCFLSTFCSVNFMCTHLGERTSVYTLRPDLGNIFLLIFFTRIFKRKAWRRFIHTSNILPIFFILYGNSETIYDWSI